MTASIVRFESQTLAMDELRRPAGHLDRLLYP
jgi:hypothetical protein